MRFRKAIIKLKFISQDISLKWNIYIPFPESFCEASVKISIMPAASTKEEKMVAKAMDDFKKTSKTKGKIKDWTDAFLLKFRDKMRLAARKTRGYWSFAFYEALQNLNKESIKRDLNPATK